jgi:glycosyltransferase involved in cell wall biosynthesis
MRGLPKLTRILRREKPDVVVVCANNTALVSAFAYRRAGLSNSRLFLKTTNPIATSRHKGIARRIRLLSYRLIFPWADAVWTLSQEESAEMQEAFPTFQGLFRSVDNPYVTPAMFARPAGSAVDATFKTVIAVARLTAQKRLDRLILAFAQIHRPGVRLLILGEGEDRQKLEDMIEGLGIGDRVSMPGYVDDVAAALHAADLFVLSSDYEGLPAVVLEAMAANCPVLGTDCFPAARALLGSTDGCGIIGRTDPEGLSALIETFLTRSRPTHLRAIAERYSIANGIASHAEAVRSTF